MASIGCLRLGLFQPLVSGGHGSALIERSGTGRCHRKPGRRAWLRFL